MDYNLARMARLAGVRRKRVTMRPIRLPAGLRRDLEAILARIPAHWGNETARLITLLPGNLTQDSPADDIRGAMNAAERTGDTLVIEVIAATAAWMRRAGRWHLDQWVRQVRASTGVDVFPFIDELSNRTALDAMFQRLTSLIRSINDQARAQVAETVWRGFVTQTPRAKVAAEIAARIGVSRSRARLIAVDQSAKIAGELTRFRQAEAGITKYKWVHSGKVHFRPEHLERDGKVFDLGKPAGDQPGDAINCGCTGVAVLDPADEEILAALLVP